MRYFSEQGWAFPGNVNPADRILDIITKADDMLYEKWEAHVGASTSGSLSPRFGFWSPRGASQSPAARPVSIASHTAVKVTISPEGSRSELC